MFYQKKLSISWKLRFFFFQNRQFPILRSRDWFPQSRLTCQMDWRTCTTEIWTWQVWQKPDQKIRQNKNTNFKYVGIVWETVAKIEI